MAHDWPMRQEGAKNNWLTSALGRPRTCLAQVPDEPNSEFETIGEQLKRALEETGVSQRQLSKRLASRTSSAESERRWLQKVLSDDVLFPEPESIAAIEVALELAAGYFVIPSQQQIDSRALSIREMRGLLESLAEKLALAENGQAETRRELDALQSRVEQLEDWRGHFQEPPTDQASDHS